MEGPYGTTKSNTKGQKFNSLNAKISPMNLNAQNFIGRGISYHRQTNPIFDPYTSADCCSDSSSLDSPLIRYLFRSSGSSSGSQSRAGCRNGGGFLSPFPLASMENFETPPLKSFPVFKAPVKVEEDVLVMDGILIGSDKSDNHKTSGGSGRMRSSTMPSDSAGRSSFSTFSVGSENTSSKLGKCQSWEDSGTCRFGSKCHFAHGNEELRPSHLLGKNKFEEKLCKSFSSGSCTYGAKCRFVHQQAKAVRLSIEPASAAKTSPTTVAAISPIRIEDSTSSKNNVTSTTITMNDWSPLDDGIAITLPSVSNEKTPPKEDVNAHIQTVLFGPSVRKRLPVFTEICPE